MGFGLEEACLRRNFTEKWGWIRSALDAAVRDIAASKLAGATHHSASSVLAHVKNTSTLVAYWTARPRQAPPTNTYSRNATMWRAALCHGATQRGAQLENSNRTTGQVAPNRPGLPAINLHQPTTGVRNIVASGNSAPMMANRRRSTAKAKGNDGP